MLFPLSRKSRMADMMQMTSNIRVFSTECESDICEGRCKDEVSLIHKHQFGATIFNFHTQKCIGLSYSLIEHYMYGIFWIEV